MNLFTSDGEELTIIHPGEHNHNAGPDFTNAKIKLGNTVWAGNVEIHIRSSDWVKHKHQHDAAYSNLILHVVFENDLPVSINGRAIPTLELNGLIRPRTLQVYRNLLAEKSVIACRHHIEEVKNITLVSWLDSLLIERLMMKSSAIQDILQQTQNDWDEAFYRMIARNFGLKVNSDPFEQLARSLPQRVLSKHKNNPDQISALLFGQAGMLQRSFKDEYPSKLKREYLFLQRKYNLKPILPQSWKFSRLRPPNFPSIRIAQLAQLVFQSSHLFRQLTETKTLKDARALFNVIPNSYWQTHWTFEKEAKPASKEIGAQTIDLILINTVIPFIFFFGKTFDKEHLSDKALDWIAQIQPEKNKIIKEWMVLGMAPENAAESQALIQLKNEYCKKRKCLSCAIAAKILAD